MESTEAPLLRIPQTVVVEGKYDKIRLSSVLDAHIVACDGFGIFREGDKLRFLRSLADRNGLIVLTDPDGGGLVIRNYFRTALAGKNVIHLYVPQRAGKEKRKKAPSKEGFLGVEGIDCETLRKLFLPYAEGTLRQASVRPITKADLYADGLSGGINSVHLRKALLNAASLPADLSANALLEALNLLFSYDEYRSLLQKIRPSGDKKQVSYYE